MLRADVEPKPTRYLEHHSTTAQLSATVTTNAQCLVPLTAVAVSAHPAWLERMRALLAVYGMCPIYQVDRMPNMPSAEAVEAAAVYQNKSTSKRPSNASVLLGPGAQGQTPKAKPQSRVSVGSRRQ